VRQSSPDGCFRRFEVHADAAEKELRDILAALSMKTLGSRKTSQRILRVAEAGLRRFNAASARAEEALRDLLATVGVGSLTIHGVVERRLPSAARPYIPRETKKDMHRVQVRSGRGRARRSVIRPNFL